MDWTSIILFIANTSIYAGIAYFVYRIIKRQAKSWIKEAITEYEKDNQFKETMRRVEATRRKYQI